jgi:hypothetical protein
MCATGNAGKLPRDIHAVGLSPRTKHSYLESVLRQRGCKRGVMPGRPLVAASGA